MRWRHAALYLRICKIECHSPLTYATYVIAISRVVTYLPQMACGVSSISRLSSGSRLVLVVLSPLPASNWWCCCNCTIRISGFKYVFFIVFIF